MAGRDGQWPLRIVGSLFGLAAIALGLFSIVGPGEAAPELNRERALGFGTVAIVVGLVALIGSLTSDARRLWYCTPRRWQPFRTDVLRAAKPDEPPAGRPLRSGDDASAGP